MSEPKFKYHDIVRVNGERLGEITSIETYEGPPDKSFSYGVLISFAIEFWAEAGLNLVCRAENREDRKETR
jgi:hypothetical protein